MSSLTLRLRVPPQIPRDLMEYLQEVFPDKLPEQPFGAPEALAALIGQQQVIRHLKTHFDRQALTVLAPT